MILPVLASIAVATQIHPLLLIQGRPSEVAAPAGAIEAYLGTGVEGAFRGHVARVRRLVPRIAFLGLAAAVTVGAACQSYPESPQSSRAHR